MGEQFDFFFEQQRTAEIVAVIDGMALAFWLDQLETMAPEPDFFVALSRASMHTIVAFLREHVADVSLETGPGTGQIVVLARPENVSYAFSTSIGAGST